MDQFRENVNLGDHVRLVDGKGNQLVGFVANFTITSVGLSSGAYVTQKVKRTRGGLTLNYTPLNQWTNYEVYKNLNTQV